MCIRLKVVPLPAYAFHQVVTVVAVVTAGMIAVLGLAGRAAVLVVVLARWVLQCQPRERGHTGGRQEEDEEENEEEDEEEDEYAETTRRHCPCLEGPEDFACAFECQECEILCCADCAFVNHYPRFCCASDYRPEREDYVDKDTHQFHLCRKCLKKCTQETDETHGRFIGCDGHGAQAQCETGEGGEMDGDRCVHSLTTKDLEPCIAAFESRRLAQKYLIARPEPDSRVLTLTCGIRVSKEGKKGKKEHKIEHTLSDAEKSTPMFRYLDHHLKLRALDDAAAAAAMRLIGEAAAKGANKGARSLKRKIRKHRQPKRHFVGAMWIGRPHIEERWDF